MRRSSKILTLTAAVVAVAAAVALAPRQTGAATATGSFTVTATVAKACSVAAANWAGTYDPFLGTAQTFTNDVNVTCTKGTAFTTLLSSANALNLVDGSTPANKIPYTVKQTNAAGADWTVTSMAGASASKATPVKQTAFFTLAAGADVPAGTYADTVTATVTF